MKEGYLGRRLVVTCSGKVWGGTEHVMLRTCEEFARRGWQVLLVVRDRQLFESRRTDPDSSVEIRQLPFANDYGLLSILRLAWMSRGADVVYVSMPRDSIIGGIAGRLVRAPVVLRKGNSNQIRDTLGSRLRYSRLPASVVVIASSTKSEFRKLAWMTPTPIHVIYTGVDSPGRITSEQRAQVRGTLGIGESELLIVGPGRLASVKRWEACWTPSASRPPR